MKVGDMVKYNSSCSTNTTSNPIMLVLETGIYAGGCDIKVMWGTKEATTHSSLLEVINEDR
jgi:hypothetical protein